MDFRVPFDVVAKRVFQLLPLGGDLRTHVDKYDGNVRTGYTCFGIRGRDWSLLVW
jgi:hypothetical protein